MISLSSLLSPAACNLCWSPVLDSTGCQPHQTAAVLLHPVAMGAARPRPTLRGHRTIHRLVVDVLPGVDPGLGRPVDFECFNLTK